MQIRRAFSCISFFLLLQVISISYPLNAIPPELATEDPQSLNSVSEQDTLKSDNTPAPRKNIISADILIMFPALGYSRIIQISKKTGVVLYGSITEKVPWWTLSFGYAF